MNNLSSLQRCLKVLNGELPDRVPVIPQSFMFAVEIAGFSIGKVNRSGRLMADALRISQDKFGYDGCVIDFDDASLAEACGAKVIYRDDEPAIVDESKPLLKDLRDIDELELPDPYKDGRLPEWLEATERLRAAIGNDVLVMGRADQGPFSLACLLRGMEQFMMDILIEDQALIEKVLDYTRRACLLFAKAQKDSGAHITSIGDALAGPALIAPETYRRLAWNPERLLTREVREYGIPFSIHICGDTTDIIEDMGKTGADVLELDWKVDMGRARKILPDSTVIMGNIDPSDPLVLGTPEQVDAIAKKVIKQTAGKGLILSSGCAMGRNTPEENMRAMVEAPKRYGNYEQLVDMRL